ncbi:uncharacterized protein LOC117481303 [Trematomus bernacchii]|uniref:uncharacterized protein LOC117481303 n=1 Tax=Trematomus bernacchii TaxID=40690 RepID=UPI00146AC3EF|nr:uncharacterized protein LOC117481303 [Trematomus bernacchii]
MNITGNTGSHIDITVKEDLQGGVLQAVYHQHKFNIHSSSGKINICPCCDTEGTIQVFTKPGSSEEIIQIVQRKQTTWRPEWQTTINSMKKYAVESNQTGYWQMENQDHFHLSCPPLIPLKNLNINWPTFPEPSVTKIVDGQLGGNKPDRPGSSNPPRISTEVDQCDEGTDRREPAERDIRIQLQPLEPGENRTKRGGTPHHPKNDGPSDATLSPRLGPPSLLDQVNTLAQSTSQAPTAGGKRSRGGKTCFEYPPKETKKYQGKVKSSNKGEPPSKRIQIDQTPHKDEEKVSKQVTSKCTDKTKKQCDPADARLCASWAGEYVAGEPVEVSPRVPPGWMVATWGGNYFICPKERCPPYGKWLDNEEPPVHIQVQDALKPLMKKVSEENDFRSQNNPFVLPGNEDGDDWRPNNDQTIGRIVLYTHSPTGGYRKCAIRYFSDPQNWDTLAGFRNGTRGFTHLPYIWKYDENWHRVLLDRSAMMWQNKGDKEFNTRGGIKSLQVTCFKTNSDSSYFAITDDGCGNKYMLTDPKREGCYEEVRDKCGSA